MCCVQAADALYEAGAIQLSRRTGDGAGSGVTARSYFERAKQAESVRDDDGGISGNGTTSGTRGPGTPSDAKSLLLTK